jgi:hypothetical protein
MVLQGLVAAHSWEPPLLGHNAWGWGTSGILFDWDKWFCKKLKKKQKLEDPFACVLLKGLGQGLQELSLCISELSLRPGPAQGGSNQTAVGVVITAG